MPSEDLFSFLGKGVGDTIVPTTNPTVGITVIIARVKKAAAGSIEATMNPELMAPAARPKSHPAKKVPKAELLSKGLALSTVKD